MLLQENETYQRLHDIIHCCVNFYVLSDARQTDTFGRYNDLCDVIRVVV